MKIPINNEWNFVKEWNDKLINTFDKNESVHIPHAMEELQMHYPDESSLWLISGYQRIITYDNAWKGKSVFVRFEGVMAVATVYINGKNVSEHKGGYTPWEIDLTAHLIDGDNLLTVQVDSRERKDVPPFGAQIDYLCYNGIYREVDLYVVEPISVHSLIVSQIDALTKPTIAGNIRLRNTSGASSNHKMTFALKDSGNVVKFQEIDVELNGEKYQDIPLAMGVDSVELWELDSPKLYCIEATLESENLSRPFGFREAMFKPDGFYLNGKKVKIRGLNRHQSFPYVGYAMPARAQKRDADILKHELGLNLVRTSHYPQSIHFLDRCDEIGLLVFEEIPGWQHIGDLDWQDLSVVNVKDMIERDIYHPSIILWGVRINESPDNHDFYTKTNAMAHSIDPTRQTGGVRCITHSELLEDVYTMNDFVQNDNREALRGQKENTGLSEYVPYLVTEYNGHMFPTKSFDQEERQVEHTKRHYNVLAAAASDEHVSGSIGWCAFDYHTHFDFGAGDRICYHGVSDIFRNPKFAASAYSAQGVKEPFLKAITVWSRGERSVGGILPLMVSTNCDYVKIFYNDEERGTFYPAEGRFRGLKHPPIIIDDRRDIVNKPPVFESVWGEAWQSGRIDGFIDGKCVASQDLIKSPLLANLEITADDKELVAPNEGEAWDTTRISVIAKDQNGNRLIFTNAVLDIKVENAELIGDSLVALEGGSYAFWVKAYNKGTARITVDSPVFKLQTITIDIK